MGGNTTALSLQVCVGVGAAATTVVGLTAATSFVLLLRRVSASVGLAPPTDAQLNAMKKEEEEQWDDASSLREQRPKSGSRCALFRHLPELTTKLAWRSLGVTGPSPIHICRIPSRRRTLENDSNAESMNGDNRGDGVDGAGAKTQDEKTQVMLQFLVKREDLISPLYGGNKVRTLQHQLAVCEARRDNGEDAFKHLVSVGSGGSNQVLATTVHARNLGWDGGVRGDVNPCWFDSDEPDFDNTLNMLSVLSFDNVGFTHDWGGGANGSKKGGFGCLNRWIKTFRALREAWSQNNMIPMMMGGNCPSAVLGQVSGVLELAEQIQRGDSPDPVRLYVPIGSGCTVSGLVLGVVMCRHLGLEAFRHPRFKIVGCNVHDGFATMDRFLNLHTNAFFRFMPLTITHSVLSACRALQELGGPNLAQEATQFIRGKGNIDLRFNKDVVGKYGGHSPETRGVAQHYDEKGSVAHYVTNEEEKPLWVCGHFVAKAFQPLLADLEDERRRIMEDEGEVDPPSTVEGKQEHNNYYMLWMTKSAIQPRGNVEEWPRFLNSTSDKVKQWATQGKAESAHRPGRVDPTSKGKPDDYRSVMTDIMQ